jgi:hypothetical protein
LKSQLNKALESPIVQAFLGAMLAVVLLKVAEHESFDWVLQTGGRGGGGGTLVASVVFLGILGYNLGRDYLRQRKP